MAASLYGSFLMWQLPPLIYACPRLCHACIQVDAMKVLSKFVHLHQELLVVGFPVRTVNAVEPVSLAALGTLDALGLAFLAVCAGPPRLGLCCQG